MNSIRRKLNFYQLLRVFAALFLSDAALTVGVQALRGLHKRLRAPLARGPHDWQKMLSPIGQRLDRHQAVTFVGLLWPQKWRKLYKNQDKCANNLWLQQVFGIYTRV
jgi:hypothetical protein